MKWRSIRWRITALATLITAVVLTACAIVVVVVVETQLEDNLDRSLEQRADQVQAFASAEPDAGLANSAQEDRFAQVLDADGRVVAATDNLAGGPAVVGLPNGRAETSTHSGIPIDDDKYRILIRRFELDGAAAYVVVGQSISDAHDAMRSLVRVLAFTIPLAVIVLAMVIWWLVGRTLRPVEQIRREVAAIGLDQLDRRVPAPGTGDEVDRLASTMNDMLGRLEGSSRRERQFVADASHELRSPLTRMRATLEVELADPVGDPTATYRSVLDDTVAMQRLVDDLLFLARHDAGRASTDTTVVDLDVIVADEVREVRPTTDVVVDTSRVAASAVRGSATQLGRLVRNLVSNAVRYATNRVEVSLAEHDAIVVLRVDDDGPGIAVAQRSTVFERFVRLDEARSSTDGGAGLGLSIVREIAQLHGGTVAVGDAPLGGVRIEVRLPGATAAEGP